MTNLEKIDSAIITTLEAHPDYNDIMGDILLKKILEDDPLSTAKYFSRANDARAHMIEVSALDLLLEVLKNAVKVSYLFEQRKLKTSDKEKDLNGKKDNILFGSTACRWFAEEIKKHQKKNVDDLLDTHAEILPILIHVFKETRYGKAIIKKEELDKLDSISKLESLLHKIEIDFSSF